MTNGTTTLTLGEDPVIVITGVPAQVCELCGEALIDSETTTQVEMKVARLRRLWQSDESDFPTEDIEVGGRPGSAEGGVVRIDYGTDLRVRAD